MSYVNKPFSVMLHKKPNVLKPDVLANSTSYKIKNTYGKGTIYIATTPPKDVDWVSIINELSSSKNPVSLKNIPNKAVVIFELNKVNKKNIYASVSFGYGASMINENTAYADFGDEVASKLLSLSSIFSISSTDISDVIVKNQRDFVGGKNNNKLINEHSEIPVRIKGLYKNGPLETTLVGHGNKLVISRKMDLIDLYKDIQYYADKYFSNTSPRLIKNFSAVNAATKKSLDDELCKNIQNNSFILSYPEILNDEATFKISGINNSNSIPSVKLSEEYHQFINKSTRINNNYNKLLTKLKRDSLSVLDSNAIEIAHRSIYKCLISEVTLNQNEKYIFHFGSWYQVNYNYYTSVINDYNNIKKSTINFPTFDSKKTYVNSKGNTKSLDEGQYNVQLNQHFNKINGVGSSILLDRKTFTNNQFQSGSVELADVLTNKNQFIHIKKGDSSANLSHLFMQGLVSAKIVATDPGVYQFIKNQQTAPNNNIFTKKPNSSSAITVIYGIIRNASYLPFFSTITLVDVVHELEAMNYNVELALIPYI
ncbi:TIGR04141 family sporadically distributed protein [Leuconostoc mesenteroides]|uniref:DUF6119 family protein n=1 Tax=Leuconostoc mesenteroides TaxID=1245 RepID=UPI002073B6A0|nr:DUF6119 family protein [Leuconostoc mesenteroides]MCM6832463.1 TIGR04141 family sporadically distributed protein [Leuconostoc mesenteroides]